MEAEVSEMIGAGHGERTDDRATCRDSLGHARKDQHGLLAALTRPIFRADSGEQARQRPGGAIAALEGPLPNVASTLADAEEDILALYPSPLRTVAAAQHQPARALQQAIGRRTDVVGIFPDDRSLIRVVGMLGLEQSDEWLVGRRMAVNSYTSWDLTDTQQPVLPRT